jgi:excisionase family DNA binding protein
MGLPNVIKQRSPGCISVGLAAKHCGVSNTTILRWITTGQLPAFRLPSGHYRIERDNFSEFLTKHSMPGRNVRLETDEKNITMQRWTEKDNAR